MESTPVEEGNSLSWRSVPGLHFPCYCTDVSDRENVSDYKSMWMSRASCFRNYIRSFIRVELDLTPFVVGTYGGNKLWEESKANISKGLKNQSEIFKRIVQS